MIITTLQSIRSDANFNLFCPRSQEWPQIVKWRIRYFHEDERDQEVAKMAQQKDTFPLTSNHFTDPFILKLWILSPLPLRHTLINLVTKCICKLEHLLVKGANNAEFSEELIFVTGFYKGDFGSAQLEIQLKVMSSNLPQVPPNDFSSVLNYLRSISTSQRVLLSQVCKFASLILVMPRPML